MTAIKLDLVFPDVYNLKLLGIMDITAYPAGFHIETPTVEITPPGFTKFSTIFSPGTINIFNSNNLNITCSGDISSVIDLPDGIWTVKYSIAPANINFVEKTFIRVSALKAKFEQIFMATDMKQCDSYIREQDLLIMDQIEAFINGAIAEANQCNNIAAMKRYAAANKLITNYLKTK